MAARLGHVLYWLGCIIAGLIALFAVVGVYDISQHPQSANAELWGYLTMLMLAMFAVAAWLIGRACRYVLAGK